MTQTTAASFPAQLAAARKALRTAEKHAAPIAPELAATLEQFNPAAYAECLAKMAAIELTIPALRAEFEKLDTQACGRCNGTGVYAGASNATRRGVRYCFKCNGAGK